MLANLHTVAMSDCRTLCVRCASCGHRGALGPDVLPIHRGNMRELVDLKLRCTKCGGRDIVHYLPFDHAEVRDFIAGRSDLPNRREPRL